MDMLKKILPYLLKITTAIFVIGILLYAGCRGCNALIMKGFQNQSRERNNISYYRYTRTTEGKRIKIPVSSKNIHSFSSGGFDINYSFLQVKVKKETVNLPDLIRRAHFYSWRDKKIIDDAARIQPHRGWEKYSPKWWHDENAFVGFDQSAVIYGVNDNGYGQGCWILYNSNLETLKAFWWSEQHLSIDSFEKRCKMNS